MRATVSSGSSPSGGTKTRAATPAAAASSEARVAARMPALSPSNTNTSSLAPARCTSSRWRSVIAVPQVATAVVTPAWCRPMASKYPSTKSAMPSLRIPSRALSSANSVLPF